jgi:hypothetical protein
VKIDVVLVAKEHAGATSVSTSVDVDVHDAAWPTKLVEIVTAQAKEGARCLRDQLVGAPAATASGRAPSFFTAAGGARHAAFTPLADVVRTATVDVRA